MMRNFAIIILSNLIPLIVANSSQNWTMVANFTVIDNVQVTKYVSDLTGITVVINPMENPIIQGYVCLPTELYSDEGLSYVAEYVAYTGSKMYPYEEILNFLSYRCMASHVSIIHSIDHTCFSANTAGANGFLKLLPIVVNHILFPKVSVENFRKNVYHVDGEGNESGQVYGFAQKAFNDKPVTQRYTIRKNAYPGINSYSYRQDGDPKLMRELTVAKIEDFFKKVYRSENLYITIGGKVDPEMIFDALKPIETEIKKTDPEVGYVKPFTSNLDPLLAKKVETVFASEKEDIGTVAFVWRLSGKLWDQIETIFALELIGEYLTSTSISPLENEFVETKKLASSVDMTINKFSEPMIKITLENVPKNNLTDIEPLFNEVMDNIINEKNTKFDIKRMRILIQQQIDKTRAGLRKNSVGELIDQINLDMIYGHSDDDLQRYSKKGTKEMGDTFFKYNSKDWINIINSTFTSSRVLVLFKPSKNALSEYKKKESQRTDKLKEDLKSNGLKVKQKELSKASKAPLEFFDGYPLADHSAINFRSITKYNLTTLDPHSNFDFTNIQFRFQLYDINSEFIHFHLFLDASGISSEDRLYITLLTEIWLESPFLINGVEKSEKDVIKLQSKYLVSKTNNLGFESNDKFFPGSFPEQVVFSAKCRSENYENVIELLRNTLLNAQFKEDKITSAISALKKRISSKKSEPWDIVLDVENKMYYNNDNYMYSSSFFRQDKFLKTIEKQMKTDSTSVLNKLTDMKRLLVNPKNIHVHMAANIKSLVDPSKPWDNFFPNTIEFPTHEMLSTPINYRYKNAFRKITTNLTQNHIIFESSSSDTDCLLLSVNYDQQYEESKKIAITEVLVTYINQQMMQRIFYAKLAGNPAMYSYPSTGTIEVMFYGTVSGEKAYQEFRNILSDHLNENFWEQTLLDSAKGQTIYKRVGKEDKVDDLVKTAIKSSLGSTQNVSYNRRLLRNIFEVTLEEVIEVAKEIFPLFFNPDNTQTRIYAFKKRLPIIDKLFKSHAISLTKITNMEKWILQE